MDLKNILQNSSTCDDTTTTTTKDKDIPSDKKMKVKIMNL